LEFSLQQYRLDRICDRKYHRRGILSGAGSHDRGHECPDQKRHGDVPPAIASFVIVVCYFDRPKTLIEDLSRFVILRRQSNRDDSLGERKAVSGMKACAVSKGAA
jgi:hypothetical protein